jgi:hypothetical protein
VGGRPTRIEAIDVLPTALVIAAAKQPSDVVDEGDGVRAHVAHGQCPMDGST